jgi:meso-butanediol dehydrogenase/(S,S)-butanediol dehydrogenase/diacetyl reductase
MPQASHPFRFERGAAVVTGAGSGIGRAVAVALAAAGATRLALVGRRAAPLAETASRARAAGGALDVVTVEADVATDAGRARVAAALPAGAGLDLLVNNAGLFTAATLDALGDADLADELEVNLAAPLKLTRALLPALLRARGSVVNVSSTLAVKPIPATVAYNAAKAALVQATRTLALELGPRGVRVNCVLPAVVDTPMYAGRYASEAERAAGLAAAAKLHPLGRVGAPEDVAHAIQFLASPAAAWITGVALPVDGGMLCT